MAGLFEVAPQAWTPAAGLAVNALEGASSSYGHMDKKIDQTTTGTGGQAASGGGSEYAQLAGMGAQLIAGAVGGMGGGGTSYEAGVAANKANSSMSASEALRRANKINNVYEGF